MIQAPFQPTVLNFSSDFGKIDPKYFPHLRNSRSDAALIWEIRVFQLKKMKSQVGVPDYIRDNDRLQRYYPGVSKHGIGM